MLVTVASVRPRPARRRRQARGRRPGDVGVDRRRQRRAARDDWAWGPTPARAVLFETALSDKAPYEHGVQCCRDGHRAAGRCRSCPPWRSSAWGMSGSSWRASSPGTTSSCTWSTAAPSSRTDERLRAVRRGGERPRPPRPDAPEIPGELPPGTHLLIMTHDHAEDAALCDAVLRGGDLGSIGLIGSGGNGPGSSGCWPRAATTRRRSPGSARPSGLAEITGKEPATIAVSVAADLLLRSSASGPHRRQRHGAGLIA